MVALRMFTTTLKNLAVELNAFIMTSTQVSNDDDEKGGFRDFKNVQGSTGPIISFPILLMGVKIFILANGET